MGLNPACNHQPERPANSVCAGMGLWWMSRSRDSGAGSGAGWRISSMELQKLAEAKSEGQGCQHEGSLCRYHVDLRHRASQSPSLLYSARPLCPLPLSPTTQRRSKATVSSFTNPPIFISCHPFCRHPPASHLPVTATVTATVTAIATKRRRLRDNDGDGFD